MNLPHDLKNFRADDYEDAFQIIPPDLAALVFIVGLIVAAIVEKVA